MSLCSLPPFQIRQSGQDRFEVLGGFDPEGRHQFFQKGFLFTDHPTFPGF